MNHESVSCSVISDSFAIPWTITHQAPGKNTGVGFYALLQATFLTQGLNLGLLNWQTKSVPFEPPGKPTCIYVYQQFMPF